MWAIMNLYTNNHIILPATASGCATNAVTSAAHRPCRRHASHRPRDFTVQFFRNDKGQNRIVGSPNCSTNIRWQWKRKQSGWAESSRSQTRPDGRSINWLLATRHRPSVVLHKPSELTGNTTNTTIMDSRLLAVSLAIVVAAITTDCGALKIDHGESIRERRCAGIRGPGMARPSRRVWYHATRKGTTAAGFRGGQCFGTRAL